MSSAERRTLTAVLWPLSILFLLVSLLAALQWYFSQDLESFSLQNFTPGYLLLATVMQLLAILAVLTSWHVNLKRQGVADLGFRQTIIMVGISTIGKYTPGKVWGVLARGAVVYRHAGRPRTAVISALAEQIALLHSGVIMALAFFVALKVSTGLGVILLVILTPSIWWIARSEQLFWGVVKFLKKARREELSSPDVEEFRNCYPAVCLVLMVMWLFASSVLWFAIRAYGVEPLPQIELVFLASLLAYLGGFAAFFAPAGLGVREGIVVALLGPMIGVSAALYISLLQRLITAGVDIALGVLALFLSAAERSSQAQD